MSSAQWFDNGSAPPLGGGLQVTACERSSRVRMNKRWGKSMIAGDDGQLDANVVFGSSWILIDRVLLRKRLHRMVVMRRGAANRSYTNSLIGPP